MTVESMQAMGIPGSAATPSCLCSMRACYGRGTVDSEALSLIDELKRRRVFRAVVGLGVVAL